MAERQLPRAAASRARFVLRGVAVATLCLAPVVVLAAAGCSDDPATAGMVSVDPGGTLGAEVSLVVTGRGRVYSTTGTSIDCPTRCYGRLVVDDPSASGAPTSVSLKAVPTPGARFLGWEFDGAELGTRGKGPDSCNPVKRAGATPSVNPSSPEITLPFAEVQGTPPANAGCAPSYAVPIAYRVIAKFDDGATIVDAGSDAGGDGGVGGDVFAPTPTAGAVAKDIGITSSYVYWRWDAAGTSGVSMSSTSSSFPSVVQQSAAPITQFEVDTYGAVWQRSDNTLYVVQSGSTSPITLNGAPTCVAVAMDSSGAYCRTAGPNGQIWSWTLGGAGPTLQFSFVPAGTDLVADTSYFFFSSDPGTINGASIVYASRPGPGDGGTFNTVASGRTGPSKLQANTSRLMWLETSGGLVTATANSSRFSSSTYSSIGPSAGLSFITPDTSSTYVWAASTSSIVRGYYTGSPQQTFRTGLVGIGGIAVDSSYVYWTQSDGRVYRASKIGF